jgi:hypothetical protein
MREYYTQFFAEVRRTVFAFWKAQVIGGMFAGVVAVILAAIVGRDPWHIVITAATFVVAGYLALLSVGVIHSVISAPVTLDKQGRDAFTKLNQQRVAEISTKDQAFSARLNEVEAQLAKSANEVIALQLEVSRRHPADDYKEAHARKLLSELTVEEIEFVKWLLHAGEIHASRLLGSNCSQDAISGVLTKGRRNGLIIDRIERHGGGTELYSSINSSYVETLKAILHPW